tara:strand:- start:125 stop:319 length:195 start_codon:yes stop_codon:yes gene_type:complete
MNLNQQAVDEFIDYLVQSMNEDVYYQLKHWVDISDDDEGENDYNKIMDFFIDNLHGSLQWISDK